MDIRGLYIHQRWRGLYFRSHYVCSDSPASKLLFQGLKFQYEGGYNDASGFARLPLFHKADTKPHFSHRVLFRAARTELYIVLKVIRFHAPPLHPFDGQKDVKIMKCKRSKSDSE